MQTLRTRHPALLWGLAMLPRLLLWCPAPAAANTESLLDVPEAALAAQLARAESAAIAADPTFQALDLARARHKALRIQAGLGPNPELEFEVEELTGTGALSSTVRYAQEVEPGDRRQARISAVDAELALLALDAETVRWELRATVQRALIDVIATQESLRLREEERLLAQESLGVAEVRVEAGQVARLEATRVRIDLLAAEGAVRRAEQDWRRATHQLALLTGAEGAATLALPEGLPAPRNVPTSESLLAQLSRNPALQRWELETATRTAGLRLERAENRHNLSWSVGLQHVSEGNDFALTGGVSWEWPRRNRNQGGIRAAELELARVAPEQAAHYRELEVALATTLEDLRATHNEAERLATQVLPLTTEVLALSQEAYRVGKTGISEVLDVQRSLIEVRNQHLDAVWQYYRAAAELRALTGWNVFEVSPPGGTK